MSTDLPNELKQYQININGHQFNVSSSYGEEHIRTVERFLNERMTAVGARSETYGPSNLALLVALNLADELLTLKSKNNYVSSEWQASVVEMCDKLDSTLGKTQVHSNKSI
ncbi:cell division protein ZapA [Deltaproteobacteria bacterium TL4]